MAANLTSSTISSKIKYAFEKAISGFGNLKLDTSEKSFSVSPAATVANTGLIKTYTLAAAASTTIDLETDLDPFGDALAASKVVTIQIIPTGTGAVAKLEPGATNPLTWFWDGTPSGTDTVTPSLSIPAGGHLEYSEPVGHTADVTHKTLKLTNTGSGTLTCTVVILCKQ
jgi:hypothetical protein